MHVLGVAESRIVEAIAERTRPIVEKLPTSQRPVRAPQHVAHWAHEAAHLLAGCMPAGNKAYIITVTPLQWAEFLVTDERCEEVDSDMRIATEDRSPRDPNASPNGQDMEQCTDWLRAWAERLADCCPGGKGVVITVRAGHAHTYIVTKNEAAMIQAAMGAAAKDLLGHA